MKMRNGRAVDKIAECAPCWPQFGSSSTAFFRASGMRKDKLIGEQRSSDSTAKAPAGTWYNNDIDDFLDKS